MSSLPTMCEFVASLLPVQGSAASRLRKATLPWSLITRLGSPSNPTLIPRSDVALPLIVSLQLQAPPGLHQASRKPEE